MDDKSRLFSFMKWFTYFYAKFFMKQHLKITEKIFQDRQHLEPLLRKWKKEKKSIVFTNGCFDLLHRGHAEYLAKSAEKGDKLVIGLNSDSSVSMLKGPQRPLMDEYSRAYLLAAFSFVSAVVMFDEETPEKIIQSVSPDFLIKGNDYSPDEIVGYDWVISHGGRVETIPLIPGWSTTSLVMKIKNLPE
jgi:D-glycero-beta-D-manno-heptose 1-phosphate adenylyltransferase